MQITQSTMALQDQDPTNFKYPLGPDNYNILAEIGRGSNEVIVYKAFCTTASAVVAIKSIPMNVSTDVCAFLNLCRQAHQMTHLSHPNVLKAHCIFTGDSSIWVVLPFMSAGSLQSMIVSSFPVGIPEAFISIILKETLMGLCYLHDQGHLHRDIKAGNILMDSNGSIKLGDSGISTSIYQPSSCDLALEDVFEMPYWIAPEVIYSHHGYTDKANIWSFGITALELAQGWRPPLSHLAFSKALAKKIAQRFRYPRCQKDEEMSYDTNPNISNDFKDMVGSCLRQDPSKRPTAKKLLQHSFFKNCQGSDFLVKNLLEDLPSLEERFKETKLQSEDEVREGKEKADHGVKRTISGWIFNAASFVLDPIFVVGDTSCQEGDGSASESVIRPASWIPEKAGASGSSSSGGGVTREVMVGFLRELKSSLNVQREKMLYVMAVSKAKVAAPETSGGGGGGGGGESGGSAREVMEGMMRRLKKSFDDQSEMVTKMLAKYGEEEADSSDEFGIKREEELMQAVIDKMKMDFDIGTSRSSDS